MSAKDNNIIEANDIKVTKKGVIEEVEKPKVDLGLFFICLFLGWFGIDKFYYSKSWRKTWSYALIKLLSTLIFVGIFWNIFDCIMILLKKYKFDFRDYFL